MPRSSAAAAEVVEFAHPGGPLEPPGDLSEQERADWVVLADAGRLGADQGPLLHALVRAMSVSRKLAVELRAMEGKSLAASTKEANKTRSIYLQLLGALREQSKLISGLSVRLRLARTAKIRVRTAERERARRPAGPRPWDAVDRQN